MKYEIENLKGQAKLTFSLSDEEWQAYVDKAFARNKSKFSVPGFRKGHATRKMVEKYYGSGVLFDDAFNACFRDCYSQALDEHTEIYPVDEPNIDIEKFDDKGLKFVVVVTIKPEVKLGAYKGIELNKIEYNVTEKDVDAEIEKVRDRNSRKVDVSDRPVADGDIVTLDYCGKVDGVAFPGGTATKQELIIGSKTFIPGFEDQMIGMNIGETADINVTFPAEYHAPELAGKAAVFTVTVHAIKAKELPELNDEFAKEVSKFDTLAEYREDLTKRLNEDSVRRADNENENALISLIVENAEVEIPACMIDAQVNQIMEEFKQRLQYSYNGMKIEDYFKYTGTNETDFRNERRPEAENTVKTRLVLEAILDAEHIEVTEEDIDDRIKYYAEQFHKEFEEYKKTINDAQRNYMRNEIIMNKLIDFLKANNTFVVGAKKASKKTVKKVKTEEETEQTVAEEKPKKTRKTANKAEEPKA